MPDYNPAVAAGIQPPQTNLLPTLEGIAQLQIGQAHAGLYSLQALQQQNDYNALGAVSDAMRSGERDPNKLYQTFIANKGNPEKANQILNSAAQMNAIQSTGAGMTPSALGERYGAENTRLGLPATRANADKAVAEKYGPPVLLDSSNDQSWSDLVNNHFDTMPPGQGRELQRQQALAIQDPTGRVKAAIGYGAAAGVPLGDLTKVFGPGGPAAGDTDANDYNNKNLTPAQRVGAAPILRAPGQAAGMEESQKESAKYFADPGEYKKQYGAAQQVKKDMVSVMNSVERLGPTWMGPGAEGKSDFIAAVNTASQSILGRPLWADEKVAEGQDLGKLANRAGFNLASSMFGASREASNTIQTSIKSVVNQGNTFAAAKIIGNGIINDAQRTTDRMDYELDNKDKMLPVQADREFDKKYPPEMYARRAIAQSIDPTHIQALRDARDPADASASFNKTYGSGMAEFVLSNPKFPQ